VGSAELELDAASCGASIGRSRKPNPGVVTTAAVATEPTITAAWLIFEKMLGLRLSTTYRFLVICFLRLAPLGVDVIQTKLYYQAMKT
jgi:hypothetical protein